MKLAFIILLLVIPLGDIGQMLYDLYQNPDAQMPDPRYVAFSALYTVGTNHILHKIMFWFLPIYLLIITGEDSLEDCDTGYRNILQSRMSKKQYVWGKARNAFCLSFLILFVSLMLNYGLLQLIFHQGKYIWLTPDIYPADENRMYTIGYGCPVVVNLANIMITSILGGCISTVGTCLAMYLRDRKIVYSVTFMLWFIFVLTDDGLMSILHPFTNMIFERWVRAVLLVICGYAAIALITLAVKVKSDEI